MKLLLLVLLLLLVAVSGCVVDDAQSQSITLQHTVTSQGVPCIVYVEQGGISCQW